MDSVKMVSLTAFSLALFAVWGCTGIGPRTITQDRFDYTGALGDSWKQQMLSNMVKVRYGDTPIFLDVASVINQYSLETGVSVSGQLAKTGAGDTFIGMGGHGTYIDRPTITYMPLSGEKFARSLMKPIPPAGILSLIQGGYPIDLVMRVCVHSLNNVRNRFGGAARARTADPEFYPVLERMKRVQSAGAIELRVVKTTEMEGVLLSFRGKVDPIVEEDILFVRKTLGLDPSASEFRVVYGSVARDDQEIAILSRSVLEIIIDLASYIEVPSAHVEEKRVNPTMPQGTVQKSPLPPLIRIHSSPDEPADTFIAVSYRNHWFWIDDRDLQSKTLFSFLMFIFSLTETGAKEGAPIITVPVG